MIKANGLKKSFDKINVLKDINFEVKKGDIVSIIGHSGSGKSTLLRSLINLETLDDGTIKIENDYLLKDGIYTNHRNLYLITSRMGMVFQNFNLFPHLSVGNNLIMPYITVHKKNKVEANKLALTLLDKVGLSNRINAMPSQLSGGQKQRIAIARALMLNPEIMLFDEPTSALDPQLTNEVLSVIHKLASEKMTMLIVTHEMSFARDVSNHILFMGNGEIIEEGSPDEIFNHPKKQQTIDFLGTTLK